jgi:hypothetical protein
MEVLIIVLLVLGLICFIAAAAKVVARLDFIALGLAFWILVELLGYIK